MLAVLVAAFWAIGVLPATTLPMTDPDTWWHIRAGDEVLQTGAIATADTWSIAGAGFPWTSQDWLSNVVLATVHRMGEWGPTLLSLLYGAAGAGAVALLWWAIGLRRPEVGPLARAGWLLFGVVLAAPVLGVRVQVIDLLLASVVMTLLWHYLTRPGLLPLAGLPIVALAWVNLHAGFPLLFLLGGAVIVGEAVDRIIGRRPDGDPLAWRELGWLIVALAASAAVLVLNPNGPAIYAYPFETLGIGALSSFVGEWQPARLDAPAGQLLVAFALLGILPTLVFARRWLRTADALVLLGLAFMAVTAVRFLLVAGPIGAAIVCLNLSPVISRTRAGAALGPTLARLGRSRPGTQGILNLGLAALLVIAGVAVTAARVLPAAQRAAVAEQYPVAAVNWIVDNDPGDRIFNRFEWGGYLGLRARDRPVFIDGRADVYGDEVIREYVEVISVNVDPQAYFERHEIDHVLYPPDSTLGRWLADSPNWEEVYADGVGSVWVSSSRSR
jgi:hypothetical protein